MRHRVKTIKLGRKSKHKEALLANLACNLIEHNRIKTTLPKAKALRPYAEKLVTLGKKGTLHGRRLAFAKLRNKDSVKKLFDDVAPRFTERQGGYTRIYKLGNRLGDAAEMALIEWVEANVEAGKTGQTTARDPASVAPANGQTQTKTDRAKSLEAEDAVVVEEPKPEKSSAETKA